LQNAGPLQGAGPLQNIAPIAAMTGLNIAPPTPGLGFGPAPLNVPGMALTPAQVTTLASGNVTTINQLLGQLVGGNSTNQQLTALVNTLVAPPTPTSAPLQPASLPPVSTPTPAPPVVTGGSTTTPIPQPSPPVITNPINYVSRS
jgi:hypothetical protein